MKGRLRIIRPGEADDQIVELDAAPTLEALQKAVGGFIEIVPRFAQYDGAPCIAFCNEEGKLKALPLNPRATALWAAELGRQDARLLGADFLVGPVAIVTGDAGLMRSL